MNISVASTIVNAVCPVIKRTVLTIVQLVRNFMDSVLVTRICALSPLSLPYPPKFSWIRGSRPPPDNFVNKYDMIRGINAEIEEMNRQSNESTKIYNFRAKEVKKWQKRNYEA